MSRLTYCLLQLLLANPGIELEQLLMLAGDVPRSVRSRLDMLKKQGWASSEDQLHWSLTAEGMLVAKAEADRTKTPLYERGWQALRHLKAADITQLVRVVAQPDDAHAQNKLTSYFNKLDLAGLVVRAKGVRPNRYALASDPGPKAPRVRKTGVYEPNAGQLLEFKWGRK